MKLLLSMKRSWIVAILLLSSQVSDAQFLMDMIDTTKEVGKGLLSIYKKFDQIHISGYMQPQFQVAQSKGAKTYAGGDFLTNVNNRFMLRRGRIRFDYARYNEKQQAGLQFVFQFDGTERGVFIRDFWGRLFENKWGLFSFTTGMFARPFGYEVNLSSSDRESPERGRMSQILMKTERDLGFMISFEPRRRKNFLKYIKADIGIFNGQGLAAPKEYDSYKDIIGRFGIKPIPLHKSFRVSAGFSLLEGGFIQNNKYVYGMNANGAHTNFQVDSSLDNVGAKAPRKYRGTDLQIAFKYGWGQTILRGEYWWGTQTATAANTETPEDVLTVPYFRRPFNGAYFYLLQHIVNEHHQVGIKYDWYDPNSQVAGRAIGQEPFTGRADIRYNTLGFGYIYYINENLKLINWYDLVKNESTSVPDYEGDVKDNIFTCRLQYRF